LVSNQKLSLRKMKNSLLSYLLSFNLISVGLSVVAPSDFLTTFTNLGAYKTKNVSANYMLYWYSGGSGTNESITIGVVAQTSGWVGFGLSENGGM
jgi:hypothetical protein